MAGQTLPDSLLQSGGGFALSKMNAVSDSLQLRILDLEIKRISIEAQQTDFWHRLIPKVSASANIGVRQLVFTDPTTLTPYVVPQDAYRLNISLSLSGILDGEAHTIAGIQLDKLRTQKALLQQSFNTNRGKAEQELLLKKLELSAQLEQAKLVDQLLEYHEMLFAQGEVKFDALLRTRLQALSIHNAIEQLNSTLSQTTGR